MTSLVTDLSVLICFGALFPPLALIVALSVLKDLMSIKLALGKYAMMKNALEDENLKTKMVYLETSMKTLWMKTDASIWNGVWHGMLRSALIWGFVLFDTLSSTVGVQNGLWVLILMTICPLCFQLGIQQVLRYASASGTSKGEKDVSSSGKNNNNSVELTIENPIIGTKEIEMHKKGNVSEN